MAGRALAVVSILLFGFVLGCFGKNEQLWAAPAKLAAGLIFSGALALAGLLLLGFAPAVWIFAESTDALGFMGTLAIGARVIAVFFALRFLKSVISATGGIQKGPLTIWRIVFLLVTMQMTTSLRPILGRSDVRLTQEKNSSFNTGPTPSPPRSSRKPPRSPPLKKQAAAIPSSKTNLP